jgi:hypothetical protein
MTLRVPPQLPLLPASDFCQRWRDQRVLWRHRHAAGETFTARGYEVAPIGRPATADFLRRHHYLPRLPANCFRFGLLRGADLVGIAVLGPGMPHTLRALFPDLEPTAESLVLDRFALLDDVKALGETWFLARVFALLRSAGIEGVATFSDPWPRHDRFGRTVHVGHIGTVFQASSAIYTGLTARETFYQLHDTGELVHRRALSKFRNGERSSGYLERVLLGAGAPPRQGNETPDVWLDRVLPLVSRPYVHGGNHRYAFLVGRHRRYIRVATTAQPYPKHHRHEPHGSAERA